MFQNRGDHFPVFRQASFFIENLISTAQPATKQLWRTFLRMGRWGWWLIHAGPRMASFPLWMENKRKSKTPRWGPHVTCILHYILSHFCMQRMRVVVSRFHLQGCNCPLTILCPPCRHGCMATTRINNSHGQRTSVSSRSKEGLALLRRLYPSQLGQGVDL